MTTRLNDCADSMSTWNHWPFVCVAPVLKRVAALPSMAFAGTSVALAGCADATQPVRDSAVSVPVLCVVALAWFDGAPPTPIVRGEARPTGGVNTVLVTSMGYYGNASAVVLRRPS